MAPSMWGFPGRVVHGLAMDLANTVTGIRPGGKGDLLSSPGDLRRWLEAERVRLGEAPEEVALRLPEFRALRDAIWELFMAAADGEALPAAAVAALNAASAASPRYPQLDAAHPSSPAVSWGGGAGSRTTEILATIARSAIEILGGPNRRRVGLCGAPGCGMFFPATRPRQVWCTASCGNRARVARHHERRRMGTTAS